MTVIHSINHRAARDHLCVVAVNGSHAFLGPLEPGFWAHFTQSDEWNDGAENPMDRWSRRVIDAIAADLGGVAGYPFGPAPYPDFFDLARTAGGTWQSPVGMLVHADAGLMVSYRGVLNFAATATPLPAIHAPGPAPCDGCHRPCTSACPIGALTEQGYDVPACRAFVQSDAGRDCLNNGCLARRVCPISQTFGRDSRQSGYHMAQFIPK